MHLVLVICPCASRILTDYRSCYTTTPSSQSIIVTAVRRKPCCCTAFPAITTASTGVNTEPTSQGTSPPQGVMWLPDRTCSRTTPRENRLKISAISGVSSIESSLYFRSKVLGTLYWVWINFLDSRGVGSKSTVPSSICSTCTVTRAVLYSHCKVSHCHCFGQPTQHI